MKSRLFTNGIVNTMAMIVNDRIPLDNRTTDDDAFWAAWIEADIIKQTWVADPQ